MKSLKTLLTLSALVAFSTGAALAESQEIDLSELTGGATSGKLIVNSDNKADCQTKQCAHGIKKISRDASFTEQVKNCTADNCMITLNIPECGSCQLTVTKQ